MKLKEWIRKNKHSDTDFGKKVGLTPAVPSVISGGSKGISSEVLSVTTPRNTK